MIALNGATLQQRILKQRNVRAAAAASAMLKLRLIFLKRAVTTGFGATRLTERLNLDVTVIANTDDAGETADTNTQREEEAHGPSQISVAH
jgi:hypothetical protein